MSKAVFVIAQNNFRDEELLDPKAILDNNKVETKIASKTKTKAVGKLGTALEPDLAISEIETDNFEAIIFVGGSGAVQYFNDPDVLKLAKDFRDAGKVVAAICIAPSILANAGILISKTVTGFPSEEENLRNKGADYTGMQVEVDGNIITAKDPSAAREFGEKIVFSLS